MNLETKLLLEHVLIVEVFGRKMNLVIKFSVKLVRNTLTFVVALKDHHHMHMETIIIDHLVGISLKIMLN